MDTVVLSELASLHFDHSSKQRNPKGIVIATPDSFKDRAIAFWPRLASPRGIVFD